MKAPTNSVSKLLKNVANAKNNVGKIGRLNKMVGGNKNVGGKNRKHVGGGNGGNGGGSSCGRYKQSGGSSHTTSSSSSSSLSSLTILTLVCIILLVIAMVYIAYKLYDKNNENGDGSASSMMNNRKSNPIDVNVNINDKYNSHGGAMSSSEYLGRRALNRIINPLLPPERDYEVAYGVPINLPSRGYPPASYQQLGVLTKITPADSSSNVTINSDDKNGIIPLMGKPTFNGSRKWTYYTATDNYNMLKLPIAVNGRNCTDDLGCDELYEGDSITIPQTGNTYKVSIYNYDKPRYIPYLM
jgi:hypothetical protein